MSGTFVVVAQSETFPGLHVRTCYGGVHPVQGGYGRLGEDRIRKMIVEFATAELATAEATRCNAKSAGLWTYEARPTAEVFPTTADA